MNDLEAIQLESPETYGHTEELAPTLLMPSVIVVARLLKQNSNTIMRTTLIVAVIALGISFLIPNEYEASLRLMPPSSTSEVTAAMGMAMSSGESGASGSVLSGMSGIADQLLGLSSQSDFVVGVLDGETVNRHIIQRFDLMKRYRMPHGYVEDCLKKLAANTDFDVDHKSNLVSVKVRDHDPKVAAEMARAFVEELNTTLAATNTSSAHRERMFLEERLQEAKVDLDNSAASFSQFSSKNTAIELPDQGKAMMEAAASLQGQVIAAEAQLRALQSQYTNDNYRIRQAKAMLDELKNQLQKLGGKENSAGVIGKYDDIYPSIRQLPLLGIKYMSLYRQLKVDEAVYEMLTKENEASKIIEARTVPTVEILDQPAVPQKKSSPRRGLITLAAMMLAFVGSCAFVIGRGIWSEMDDSDERKIFSREVLSGVRSFTTDSRLGFWIKNKISSNSEVRWSKRTSTGQ